MVVNAKKTYFSLLVIVLLSQLYLPSFRYNFFLQLATLAFVLYYGKSTLSRKVIHILTPIILIVLLACVISLFHNYKIVNIIKDIFHVLKPVLGIAVGYFILKQVNDFRAFVKVIIITAACCAAYHFIKIIIFSGQAESVSDLRLSGLDNFLELFALVLLLFSTKFSEKPLFGQKKYYFLLLLLSASNFMYFSRTMIVVFVVVVLSISGHTRLSRKSLKVIAIVIGTILLMYAYLFSIKIDRQGSGLETFFYKVKNAPLEVFKTKIDIKNHADLWDHWRGYEAKRAIALLNESPQSYIVGTGCGSLVNLKFWAPLGDSKKGMRYISELHNGYIYVLYKVGIVGLLLMLSFLYRLYIFTYRPARDRRHQFLLRVVSSIGLLFFFTSLTITGIYNQFDVIVILLGGFLFFEGVSRQDEIATRTTQE